MTAGAGGESRRVVFAEFVGDPTKFIDSVSQMTDSIGDFGGQLGKLENRLSGHGKFVERSGKSYHATRRAQMNEFARMQGYESHLEMVLDRRRDMMFNSWLRMLAAVGVAYVGLKKMFFDTADASSKVEVAVNRQSAVLARAGVSAGELADEYLRLGKNAEKLIGLSATFARAGVVGHEAMVALSKVSGDLGDVIGMEAEKAGDALVALAQKAGIPLVNMENLASVSAHLATQFNISWDAIESAVGAAPDIANRLNIPVSSLAALGAAFEMAGIRGSKAGGAVADILNKLGGPELGRKLRLIGIDTDDFTKKLQTDPVKALQMITNYLDTMGEAGLRNITQLGVLSGEQVIALQNMSKRWGDIEAVTREAGIAWGDTSKLGEAAALVSSSLTDRLKDLWKTLGMIGARIGDYFKPIISAVVYVLEIAVDILGIIPSPILALGAAAVVAGVSLTGLIMAFVWGLGMITRAEGMMRKFAGALRMLSAGEIQAKLATVGRIAVQMKALIFDKLGIASEADKLILKQLNTAAEVKNTAAISANTLAQAASTTATNANTVATAANTKTTITSGLAESWVLLKKKAAVLWTWLMTKAELALGAVRKLGIAQNLAYAAGLVLQAIGFTTAATACFGFAAAEGAATAGAWALQMALNALGIGLIILAIVGLTYVFYRLYKMITSTSTAVQVLGVMIAAAILGPLGSVIAIIWVTVKLIRLFWNVGKAVFDGVRDAVFEILSPFIQVYKSLSVIYDMVVKKLSNAFYSFRGTGSAALSAIRTGVRLLLVYLNPLRYAFFVIGLAAKLMGYTIAVALDTIQELFSPVIDAFSELWVVIKNAFAPLAGIFASAKSSGSSLNIVLWAVSAAIKVLVYLFLYPLATGLRLLAFLIKNTINSILFFPRLLLPVFRFLREGVDKVIKTFRDFAYLLTYPLSKGISVLTTGVKTLGYIVDFVVSKIRAFFGGVASGAKTAASAISYLFIPFRTIANAADWVWDSLFGSGLFGIDTAILDLRSPFYNLIGYFSNTAEAAIRTKRTIQDMMDVARGNISIAAVTPEVVSNAASKALEMAIGVRPAAPMAAPARKAATPVRGALSPIVIPVTLTLEDEVIAKTVVKVSQEQLRLYHNMPASPMRGIPTF